VSAPDPRAEAQRVVGDRYDVRVLEPSPPALQVEPFSDDPTARGHVVPGRLLLAPTTDGDLTWDAYARRHPEHAGWCAQRWLGAWHALQPIADVDAFRRSLDAWHTVAERVVAKARHDVNGKIGLRWTVGGFATPFFGADDQVRVDGEFVVRVRGDGVDAARIGTLAQVAAFAGVEPGVPGDLYAAATDPDPRRPLAVDVPSAQRLSDWYGFATSVLAELRSGAPAAAPSLVQLWPEHFDVSVDCGGGGGDGSGTRATYGASPGDEQHPEPYLYVSVANDAIDRSDAFWNEPFGASLPYGALAGAADGRDVALTFLRAGAARLQGDRR
jgi:hypothetical protein